MDRIRVCLPGSLGPTIFVEQCVRAVRRFLLDHTIRSLTEPFSISTM